MITFACVCVLVCNPFIPTAAVLSGVCKEASDSKRLAADAPSSSSESAAPCWLVYSRLFCVPYILYR